MNLCLPLLFGASLLSPLLQEPKFQEQVLDTKVAIGYGLAIGDVDGDRKPDILLADKKQGGQNPMLMLSCHPMVAQIISMPETKFILAS